MPGLNVRSARQGVTEHATD